MAAPIKSDDHLPEPEKRSRIWLPGMQTPKDVAKKLLIPAKRILVPQGKGIDPDAAATAGEEMPLAVRYNRQQRRRIIKVTSQMRRRQLRKEARKQRRLDQALYDASATSHSHVRDAKTQRWVAVRFDAKGKRLAAIGKPLPVDIRPRAGYLEANGPKQLRKSEHQLRLENDGLLERKSVRVTEGGRAHVKVRKVKWLTRAMGRPAHFGAIRVTPPQAVFAEGKQHKRQKGTWAPPKPKAKATVEAAA